MQVSNQQFNSYIQSNEIEKAREVIHHSRKSHHFSQWDTWVTQGQYDAIVHGTAEAVRMFVEENITFDKIIKVAEYDYQRLMITAVKTKDVEKVKAVVESGYPLKGESDYYGNCWYDNPIKEAVLIGEKDVVTCLLDHGADVNASYCGSSDKALRPSILCQAAVDGNREIVGELIKRGANLRYAFDRAFLSLYYNTQDAMRSVFSDNSEEGLNLQLTSHGIRISAGRGSLEHTLKSLEWKTKREKGLKILFDFSVGFNISPSITTRSWERDLDKSLEERQAGSLEFLKGLDVSGMNFIGVSVKDHPITPKVLKHVEGCYGIENAIFTLADLENLDDHERADTIKSSIRKMCAERGVNFDDAHKEPRNMINLVPYPDIVSTGNQELVERRLSKIEGPIESKGLIIAIGWGYVEIANMLMNKYGVKVPEKEGGDAGLLAMQYSLPWSTVLQFLTPTTFSCENGPFGFSALHRYFMRNLGVACYSEDPSILDVILKYTPDINKRSRWDGDTPLMKAFNYKQKNLAIIVEKMIRAGANPYIRNREGKNAFDLCTDKPEIKAILETTSFQPIPKPPKLPKKKSEGIEGAEKNIKVEEEVRDETLVEFDQAIVDAARRGFHHEVKALYDEGIKRDDLFIIRKLKELGTKEPSEEFLQLLSLLVDQNHLIKADVNLRDENGDSALHVAAENAQLQVFKLLVDAGAYPDSLGKWGYEPTRRASKTLYNSNKSSDVKDRCRQILSILEPDIWR